MENPLIKENFILDSVNILLETINVLPLEDENDFDLLLEARIAETKLTEVKRAVLSEGWDFNTDVNWTFPLDIRKMIPVPQNVLDITANQSDVIMRSWRLYSKSDQSHIFEEEVPATVIWDMDFNELSHPLRHYITIRAARIFQARMIGDSTSAAFNNVDEEDAFSAFRRSESRTGQFNMLTGTFGTNNRVRIG